MSRKLLLTGAFVLAFTLISAVWIMRPTAVRASDHDDGEIDAKGRSLNLTDVFAFREGDQTGIDADNSKAVFIMTVNPRSIARQQYFFSQRARYEMHVRATGDSTQRPTGIDDYVLRFTFGAPDSNSQQSITMTVVPTQNGVPNESQAVSTNAGGTDPAVPGLGTNAGTQPVINSFSLGLGSQTGNVRLFAGLREDQFFFDVEQYFKVRAGALGLGPAVAFKPASSARDSFAGFNLLAIALEAPISLLQAGKGTDKTTFDLWAAITLPTQIGVP